MNTELLEVANAIFNVIQKSDGMENQTLMLKHREKVFKITVKEDGQCNLTLEGVGTIGLGKIRNMSPNTIVMVLEDLEDVDLSYSVEIRH